ncbi:MAG: MoaD/ThiS family protein [Desulfovibrio sp.]|jgi:molybdopterin converting factor small subunit|nr:MoaD/ThiS family protein [Desulfovibrio sp.]
MAVTLLIPSALRSFTDRRAAVRVEGKNVGEALSALTDSYPDIRAHLYDGKGELRPFVNLYLGETNIKNTGGTATPLQDGDEVILVPSIAGGRTGRTPASVPTQGPGTISLGSCSGGESGCPPPTRPPEHFHSENTLQCPKKAQSGGSWPAPRNGRREGTA